MKKTLLTLLFLISCKVIAQDFISNLKPVYWNQNRDSKQSNKLNNYPAILAKDNINLKTKDVTFFLVTKCEENNINNVLSKGNTKLKIVESSKNNLNQGVLFASTHTSIKKIKYSIDLQNKANLFYEIIIFDKLLEQVEQSKIETYLSIKYGVSLAKTINYINDDKEIIWDNQALKSYNQNVFGVGIFKTLDFKQLQSVNSEDNTLKITLQPKNDSDEKFVLIGNNNASEKIWYLKKKNINENDLLAFEINSKEENIELVMSKDENFSADFKIIALRKMEHQYISDFISIDNYDYIKVQKIENRNTITNNDITETKSIFDDLWMIYPNPNEGKFSLKMNFNDPKNVSYKIYDVLGKLVSDKNIGTISNHVHAVQEILAIGVYYMQLQINSEISIKKIIIK